MIYLEILTPWRMVLLGKLIVSQLVKKVSAFYGNPVFLTVFTKAHHMSVS
jgi:hypothetical protein